MDVIEAIHGRRSIRAFQPSPIARDMLEAIIADAVQAPPPHRDLVPWSFNIVEGVDRIAGYGVLAMQYARDNRPEGPGWGWIDWPDFKIFWDAPAVIVVSGTVEDCCRAGQNMMLSAHARSLGTCWVGSPMLWLGSAAGRAAFAIPSDRTPVAVLCIGHPAAIPPPPPRGQPTIIWA